MPVATGLDVLAFQGFAPLLGKRIALVCNQSAVSGDFRHVIDLLLPLHGSGRLTIKIVLGPQHGLFGHTQDNMIEWEGTTDPRTGLQIASLYGEHRHPRPALLKDVDIMVIDLPDIGSRYYTFLWTTANCLEAAAQLGIPVLILDRPNPIGGLQWEGPVLKPEYESFVGLHPLPTRHGMTLGEVATYLKTRYYPGCDLNVVLAPEWSRGDYAEEADAVWTMPSPNMPTVDTAVVYPGGCLLEGTNLSEGRGTTHPFEMFGAPWIDGWALGEALNVLDLPGCFFRAIQFQPTFQKHAGQLCGGCFLHVQDRRAFEPVLTYVALLQETRRIYGDKLAWNPPPYEYETKKLPIDILAGNDWLRPAIDELGSLKDIRERMLRECYDFEPERRDAMLYPHG
jgi:uncharacterized protein YbbC (DUF1343 family)